MSPPLPRLDGVEHRLVEAGDVRLHVAEAGSGDPVLLLHGAPQHWWCWHRVIPLLAPRYRLIAPDFRGQGWSDAPAGGHDGETYARDVAGLLDALGLESAHVIGHDWGGHVGWLLAARFPERVRTLMAVDAPHLWVRPSASLLASSWRAWYTLAFAAGGARRRWLVAWMLRAGGRRELFDDAEVDRYADVLADPARAAALAGLYRYYHRVGGRTLRRRYDGLRLTMPVRLLYGDQDPLLPPPVFAGAVPADDYAVEAVAGAGHFLPEERPELVAERARALLTRPAPAASVPPA